MKRYFSAILAVTVVVGLAACGAGTPHAVPTAEAVVATATASSAPTSRTVPNVAGKLLNDGWTALKDAGFDPTIYGRDGKEWGSTVPDETVRIKSTVPSAGTSTAEKELRINVGSTEAENTARAAAAAAAAALAERYTFNCTGWPSLVEDGEPGVYKSLEAVWASPEYKSKDASCSVQIEGGYPTDVKELLPSEKAVVKVIVAHGGGTDGIPALDFASALGLCAKPDSDYADKVVGPPGDMRADAYGALSLCPKTPHVALLRQVATTVKIDDGTYTVGKNLEAGTYKTKPGAKDCYWSRSDGGGNILDNGFVGFAPDGVTVTVYPGEGFESKGCPIWTKIG